MNHHHHHHHVMPPAQISLTLSRHFSLSFIAAGRSSGLRPVSSQSCGMYVQAGRHAFAQLYIGVCRSTSLMNSSLLLRQCPACLVRLTCIDFVMGGMWPYSWCFVGCCPQDLFNISRRPGYYSTKAILKYKKIKKLNVSKPLYKCNNEKFKTMPIYQTNDDTLLQRKNFRENSSPL